MCKIAICDDDKEYREKIKTVIKTEGILSSNEIRFYEYESGKGSYRTKCVDRNRLQPLKIKG